LTDRSLNIVYRGNVQQTDASGTGRQARRDSACATAAEPVSGATPAGICKAEGTPVGDTYKQVNRDHVRAAQGPGAWVGDDKGGLATTDVLAIVEAIHKDERASRIVCDPTEDAEVRESKIRAVARGLGWSAEKIGSMASDFMAKVVAEVMAKSGGSR
jgi:hypothetical protein